MSASSSIDRKIRVLNRVLSGQSLAYARQAEGYSTPGSYAWLYRGNEGVVRAWLASGHVLPNRAVAAWQRSRLTITPDQRRTIKTILAIAEREIFRALSHA